MSNENKPASEVIADFIHQQIIQKGISYDTVADELGRARSYTALRIRGKKAWDMHELDVLAELLHYANAFALVNAARQSVMKNNSASETTPQPEPEEPSRSHLKPITAEIRAEIDDLEARLARSQARIAQLKDYEVVADRSEREDEEWFD